MPRANDTSPSQRKPKLISDRYMRLLNLGLENEGRATVTKEQFMWLLSILDRHQQKMLRHQFDELLEKR